MLGRRGRTVMAVASPWSSFLSDLVPGVLDRDGGTQKRALQDVRVHAPDCALLRSLSRRCVREAVLPCELGVAVEVSSGSSFPLCQRLYVLLGAEVAELCFPVRSARRACSRIQLLRRAARIAS